MIANGVLRLTSLRRQRASLPRAVPAQRVWPKCRHAACTATRFGGIARANATVYSCAVREAGLHRGPVKAATRHKCVLQVVSDKQHDVDVVEGRHVAILGALLRAVQSSSRRGDTLS